MGKIKDMSGQKFGRLTVLKYLYSDKRHKAIWQCKCECGKIHNVRGDMLRNGRIQSCGCLQDDRRKEVLTKHNKSHTRLYKVYHAMKTRCTQKNNREYKNYGARGIVVCQEWLDDFMNFYNWAMDNGYRDGLSIDRIDVNGNYEPSNCRWTDQKTQNNNKRNNIYLNYNGKTQTLMQWVDELNLTYSCVQHRYERGWSTKEILFGRQKNA